MNVCLLVCMAGLGASGVDQVIDGFQYADTQAARGTWTANYENSEKPGEASLKMVAEAGRAVLELGVPFATRPKMTRVYMDRRLDVNLAGSGAFALEIATDSPESAGNVNVYFRSGGGWYSSGQGLVKKGWQTLHYSKASFRPEDTPAGWQKIDGVRIAVWRGQAKDFTVRLRSLVAVRHDVAVVVPAPSTRKGDRELRTSLQTAGNVAAMLAELGLGSDAVEDAALAHGALGKRRLAVLAHNPGLPDDAAAELEKFVRSGGKLLVCYGIPARLGPVLGFERKQHVGRERPGQFAEIRFEADDVAALPKSVKQASWNITVAGPAGHNARVIGRWFDDEGKPTGHAAMLLSDRGAYFSHIILPDDRSAKKQLLAAVLGHLAPPLWKQMAEGELERSGKVGHCDGLEQLSAHVKANGNDTATRHLESAKQALAEATKRHSGKDHPQAVALARKAHDELTRAYFIAQPSPEREGRAFWNHSGTGAYDGDWPRTAKLLSEAGFNMVIPNLLWAGRAHYPSDLLPRSKTYQEHGDQIAQCVAAAKKYGLQVHVWKVNFNLSGAPREFVDKLRAEGRTQVSFRGKPHNWLCPSHPENRKLELESMLEVARKYDVDGLHFDYIRYPNRDHCYCDGCRKRFEADSGRKVADWPKDCYSGSRREEYTQWRCDQITPLVAAVHREGKKIRKDLKISAAVFGAYPGCRETIAQDWPEWIKAGYLDFVCPMDYSQSDLRFIGLVSNQLKLVGGRIPVYPGIGAWRLPDDRTVGQIHHARSLGAAGFTIFNLNAASAESTAPAVGMGVGAKRATPPH